MREVFLDWGPRSLSLKQVFSSENQPNVCLLFNKKLSLKYLIKQNKGFCHLVFCGIVIDLHVEAGEGNEENNSMNFVKEWYFGI